MNEFSWPVRVYYEDTDLGGVVYYANYLKFMERARTEWLRSHGIEQNQLLEETGLLFVITACALRFHRPAKFNDLLDVRVMPADFGRSRFTVEQAVMRGEETLVTGRVTAACIEASTFRPRPIPKNLLSELHT